MKISSFTLKVLLFTALVAAGPRIVWADILRTGNDVFQTTDGRGKIVVSRDEPGLFIAVGEPIDMQLFDPAQLKSEGTEHVFIRFDRALNSYVKILFGKKRSYRIVGSLTFVIGNLRVAIDNANGYLSIVETTGTEDSVGLLGIRGIEPVARFRGITAIALLEANQLSPYRGVVKNFKFSGNELSLDGQPVTSSAIGLTLEPPKNPCVGQKNKVYLTPRELATIRDISGSAARVQAVDALLKKQRKSDPLDALVLVKISEDSVVALDYEAGNVKTIRPHSSAADNQICVIEELALK